MKTNLTKVDKKETTSVFVRFSAVYCGIPDLRNYSKNKHSNEARSSSWSSTMSNQAFSKYRPYIWAVGLTMALGPLTAMSVSSVLNGTAGQPVVVDSGNPLPNYDSTRVSSLDHSGKLLADIAAGSGSLDFFSSVLDAAEISPTLRGPEQYTVFIPVNDAFTAAGGETLASMMNDPDRVKALAKSHVVPGRITATDLMAETRLQALNGAEITSQVGADITVNGARIIGSELAENGIVHYVDRLL
jgi:uncharacterized surface protein with fasciclin (FAS1) repeats